MTSLQNHAQWFQTKAKSRHKLSSEIYDAQTTCYGVGSEMTLLETPYLNAKYHLDALWYPLYNFINLLLDAIRLVIGIFLYIGSLFAADEKAQTLIGDGILHEACAVSFDLMNTYLSIISLISRTVSSIINGYAADMAKETTYNALTEVGTWDFFANIGAGVAKALTHVALRPIEENISHKTFQF